MKYLAEFIGTLVLVFVGIGAWSMAGSLIGAIGIGLAFGIAYMVMYYMFAPLSGAYFNPAVCLGSWIAGEMTFMECVWHILCQFAGAIVGVFFVYCLLMNQIGTPGVFVLGQNGWGFGYGAEYNLWAAMLFEFIATFIFVYVFLELTAVDYSASGIAIGLMLSVLIMVGLPISGGSFNPARSFAPALFLGGIVMKQVWMFLLVPTVAGLLAGTMRRFLPFNPIEVIVVDEENNE